MKHRLGEVLFAPADIVLDNENVLQPEVFFIAADRRSVAEDDYVQGAPDLVVEVVSAGTVKCDRGDKLKLYERYGVGEYWLVDTRTRSVEVYTNADRDFTLQEVYAEDHDMVRSAMVLSGFEVRHATVFAGL